MGQVWFNRFWSVSAGVKVRAIEGPFGEASLCVCVSVSGVCVCLNCFYHLDLTCLVFAIEKIISFRFLRLVVNRYLKYVLLILWFFLSIMYPF